MEDFITGLFTNFGLIGLFIASILANATIIFPIVIEFVVVGAGAASPNIYFAILIGVVCGIGAAIGEMSSYVLGLMGNKYLEKTKPEDIAKVERITQRLKEKGMIIIILGAFTPFPFDLIGIAAGLVKYDFKRFFIGAVIGKVPRYLIASLTGFFGRDALLILWQFFFH